MLPIDFKLLHISMQCSSNNLLLVCVCVCVWCGNSGSKGDAQICFFFPLSLSLVLLVPPLSLGRCFRIRVSDMNYVYRQLISSENVLKLLIGQPSGCQRLQHTQREKERVRHIKKGREGREFGSVTASDSHKNVDNMPGKFLSHFGAGATGNAKLSYTALPLPPTNTLSNFRLRTRRLAGAKQTGPQATLRIRCVARAARSAFNENNETEACRRGRWAWLVLQEGEGCLLLLFASRNSNHKLPL